MTLWIFLLLIPVPQLINKLKPLSSEFPIFKYGRQFANLLITSFKRNIQTILFLSETVYLLNVNRITSFYLFYDKVLEKLQLLTLIICCLDLL